MKAIDLHPGDERLVQMCRALGNPMRFRILQALAERQACVCGDLVELLPLAQSSVSEHLKVLKSAGLIRGDIDGPSTCYCIEPEGLAWLRRTLGALFNGSSSAAAGESGIYGRSLIMVDAINAGAGADQIRQAVSAHYAGRAAAAQAVKPLTMLPMLPAADDACCAPADAACATGSCGVGYSAEDLASLPSSVTSISLGCGNPVGLADVRTGETVLDLGSGGGIDCFLAARRAGPDGRVIGVDMTPDMVRLARANARETGTPNVEFRLGEIEHLPVDPATVDLVISNCVVNLAPDKAAVFSEVFRVLRPGGRLVISDTMATAPIPAEKREQADQWGGCTVGSLDRETYFGTLREAGLGRIEVLDEHDVDWGDLGDGLRVVSVTLRAYKVG